MTTTFTPVNVIGQKLGAGDERALHRDLFAGELLTKFHDLNVTKGHYINKVLKGGKSYKFPVFGSSTGAYVHSMGERIVPKTQKRSELTISLDKRLYDAIFLDELDEIMADVDARSIYVAQMAANLAKQQDSNILRMMVKAAESAGLIPGDTPGGSVLVDAGYRTNAAALAKGIFDAATELKTKNMSLDSVVAFITPAQEAMLVLAKETINRDWGGEGSYAAGSISRIGGIRLVTTNHLPSENLSTDATIAAAGLDPQSIFATYRGDYSKVAAIVCSNTAVATVTAVDMDVRFIEQKDSYGELIAASYAYGSGVYRPEGAVVLKVA